MHKEIIIKILATLATLFSASMLISGIEIKNYSNVLTLSIILATIQSFSRYFLAFLTIPTKITTIFITNLVFNSFIIYVFKIFVPEFYINDGYIGPFFSESINIPKIDMKSYVIIIIIALLISMIDSVVNWALNKNK